MKRQITVLFVLLALLLLSPAAFAQGGGELGTRSVVDSGTCGAQGDNLSWVLYDDGELVISGSGDMTDYHPSEGNTPPWYSPSDPGIYWSLNAVEITSLTVEEGVTSLGEWAFHLCTKLTDVSLPHSLREIRRGAFGSCRALSALNLPEGLVTICADSFTNTNLREITFPASLQNCQDWMSGDAVFPSTPLMNIYVAPDSPYFCSVDGVVFSKDQTTLVMFPTGRTGSYTVPAGVQTIGLKAFDASNLDTVVLPDSVLTIDDSAFMFARISSCTLPNSVTGIGRGAFGGCDCILSITIPEGVKSIGFDTFVSCTNLTEIQVAAGNSNYCSIDGCLYSKDQTEFICYPAGKSGSIIIPDSVSVIGISCFACSQIQSCEIPNSVKEIGYYTFSYCQSLTSVTIPDSVKEISAYAFDGCYSLTDVYYAGLPAQWATIRMGEGNDPLQQATIHYIPWPEAQTLVLPAELTEIGEEAFAGGAFTYVRLAEHTTAIGAHAFADCAQLQYIYIPATCTEIAADAFEGISDLTILGPADSAAQRFASAHGFRFLVS